MKKLILSLVACTSAVLAQDNVCLSKLFAACQQKQTNPALQDLCARAAEPFSQLQLLAQEFAARNAEINTEVIVAQVEVVEAEVQDVTPATTIAQEVAAQEETPAITLAEVVQEQQEIVAEQEVAAEQQAN